MQKIFWEDEIKLMAGCAYNINFDQDFSTVFFNGQPITDILVDSIIEFLNNPRIQLNIYDVTNPGFRTAEDYRRSQEFEEALDEYIKKEKKCEIKWKKKRKKRKKDYKRLWKEIESGEYFWKGRRK